MPFDPIATAKDRVEQLGFNYDDLNKNQTCCGFISIKCGVYTLGILTILTALLWIGISMVLFAIVASGNLDETNCAGDITSYPMIRVSF